MALKYQHIMLFVDDEESIIRALKRLFRRKGHLIMTASSGQKGLEALQAAERPVSLIISDQRMPGMNGAEFFEKAKKIVPDAIRILLTGYSDMDAIVDAINKGEIHRYLTKPWNDDDLVLQVQQSLKQYELLLENRRLMALTKQQNKELSELNRDLEKKVEQRTERIRQSNQELEKLNRRLEKSFFETIRLLSSLVSTLNPVLGEYMAHVAQLSREMAREYGLEADMVDQIEMAAMIHDIGLLGLPEVVWKKDVEDMADSELKIFKSHPVIASTCLGSVDRLSSVAEMILCHHENVDGSGFPNGLEGDEIPVGSQIIGVASDYCKMVDLGSRDPQELVINAKKVLDAEVIKQAIEDPGRLIREIAEKRLKNGIHQKYHPGVVSKLIKINAGNANIDAFRKKGITNFSLVDIRKLKEGMVLKEDLRLKDNRLLLVKGTRLKESTITTIRRLANGGLVESQILVSLE